MPDVPAARQGRPSTAECLLAFDFGTRFVGVAIGNTISGDARPLCVIEHQSNDVLFASIARLLAEWAPARLVVGVPRHPDGQAHEMTQRAERFARQLNGRFGCLVERVDERYSTVEADADQRSSHRSSAGYRSSARNDASAAAVILRQYLNQVTVGSGHASA